MPRPAAAGRPGTSIVGDAVAVGTAISDAAMPDLCAITRPAAAGAGTLGLTARDAFPAVFTDEFGQQTGSTWTPTAGTPIYSGPCRAQAINSLSVRQRTVIFGDEPSTLHEYVVAVPPSVTTVDVNDTVTITKTTDAKLAGQSLRVANVPRGSFTAVRYLICEVDDDG